MASGDPPPDPGPRSADDSRVVRAVAAYLAEAEAGRAPDRAAFLARHPDAAAPLAECLAALEFVRAAAPAADAPPAPVLGDYRIVREVGRGGMGVVYEAEQVSLGRRVALKVLPAAAALDPRHLQRFRTEAQAAAQLRHPHVVPVHAVGCEGGVHFLAMAFIDGPSLAAVLAGVRRPSGIDTRPAAGPADPTPPGDARPGGGQTPVPPDLAGPDRFRAAVGLAAQAADALDHAHAAGVVHRDVKPGNLLIEPGGHLWVSDFGLARLGGADNVTRTGELVGTLRYMSPEQAAGAPLDHRTDVYSLGATLYELLTLRPAVPGTEARDILRRIGSEEPVPPRRLDRAIPRDLETVVLKALAKEPTDRYATAAELADDLGRFLADRPITARPPTTADRVRKWGKRNRRVLAAAAAVAILFLSSAVVGLAVTAERIRAEQGRTERANADLVATNATLDQRNADLGRLNADLGEAGRRRDAALAFATVQLARRDWLAGDLAAAATHLAACPPDARRWEWHYLDRLCRDPGWRRETGWVWALAVSPGGDRLVASVTEEAPDGASRQHRLRCADVRVGADPAAADLWAVPLRGGNTFAVAFGRDGGWVATAEWHRSAVGVTVRDADTGRERVTRVGGGLTFPLFPGCSADGRCVAAVLKPAGVDVWDVEADRLVTRFPAGPRSVHSAAWSPDGRRIALVGRDAVEVRDAGTGGVVWSWAALRPHEVRAPVFGPGGRTLAAVTGPVARVWDLATGREVAAVAVPAGTHQLAFSPDGERLAAAGGDRVVRVWNLPDGTERAAYRGHADQAFAVAFCADGPRLVSGSRDRTVRVWDTREPAEGRCVPGWDAPAHAVAAIDPTGRRIAAQHRTGKDASVVVVEAATGRTRRLAAAPPSAQLAFGPGGTQVIGLGGDGWVRVWDATTAELVATWATGFTSARAMGLSADGRLLAVSDARAARVFEFPGGGLVREVPAVRTVSLLLAFDPGGRLAVGQDDGGLTVWDLATGARAQDFRGTRTPWPVPPTARTADCS